MTTPAPRILILDDHHLFRSCLCLLLEREAGCTVVGQAGDAATAVGLAETLAPDLVLTDIHLPGQNGLGAARLILEQNPAVKIIFLSSDPDVRLVRQAIELGGHGYLLKENAPQELLNAIPAVLKGGIYLCPQLTAALLHDYQQPHLEPTAQETSALSERETTVLRCIAEGLRNKEIAARLQLSQKSVETYRSRLLKKLGCTSTAEVVRHAIREGLISA